MKRFISIVLMLAFCTLLSTMSIPADGDEEAGPGAQYELAALSAEAPALSTDVPSRWSEPALYSISFIGDCTLANSSQNVGIESAYSNVVGDDYGYPFEKTVHLLSDDDFTLANLECVLSDHDIPADKNFVFKAVPEYANILVEGSVEFVSLGNNHVEDYGEQGYEDTKAALDAAGISYAGRDEWTLYDANGLLIGVYAASFGSTAGIKAGIQALREAGAEFIIAALHWGDEGSYQINDIQYNQGRAAIDAGADVVYGSHPHTLQPIEEYLGKYIFYSMGNWSFGGNTNPRDKDTVLVKLEVTKEAGGSVYVSDLLLIPCASSGIVNGNNYQPVPYEEGSEEYERTLSKLDGTFSGANLAVNYEYNFNEY